MLRRPHRPRCRSSIGWVHRFREAEKAALAIRSWVLRLWSTGYFILAFVSKILTYIREPIPAQANFPQYRSSFCNFARNNLRGGLCEGFSTSLLHRGAGKCSNMCPVFWIQGCARRSPEWCDRITPATVMELRRGGLSCSFPGVDLCRRDATRMTADQGHSGVHSAFGLGTHRE